MVKANAFGVGGKCLRVREQMPLILFANAIGQGGKCLWLW